MVGGKGGKGLYSLGEMERDKTEKNWGGVTPHTVATDYGTGIYGGGGGRFSVR